MRLICFTLAFAMLASPGEPASPATPGFMDAGSGKPSLCPAGAIRLTPGVSIQAEVDARGPRAVFCLAAGVYRAQAVRPLDGQRFIGEPGAILDGAATVVGFRQEGDSWEASFDLPPVSPPSQCLANFPACGASNVVFFDGEPLAPAVRREDLRQGRAFLDYHSRGVVLAQDPRGHSVEIALARFAFKSAASGVSISNVTIRKFASPPQAGAVDSMSGYGWSIEDCDVFLNSGAGIALGPHSSVRRCRAHHNGQIGVKGRGEHILVEDDRVYANNFAGFDPAWEAGGVKLVASRDSALRDDEVKDNTGAGLWCDTDCLRVEYVGNVVSGNSAIGIFHEISYAASIHDNRLSGNGKADSDWFWGADIVLAGSSNVRVSKNTIDVAAGRCGIVLIDQNRARDGGGRYSTRLNLVTGNDMSFEGRPCAGGISDASPGDENYGVIENGGNVFDGNTYRAPHTAAPGRFAWGREVEGWDAWRALGPETHGVFVVEKE